MSLSWFLNASKRFFLSLINCGWKRTAEKVVRKISMYKEVLAEEKKQRPQIEQAKLAYRHFKKSRAGINAHSGANGKEKELTLITFSYNTPNVVATMLRSYLRYHGSGPHNLLLFENSTNEETARMLAEKEVPFVRNMNGTHPESLDLALKVCGTRYALVVDSDIVFNAPVTGLLDLMVKKQAALLGEVCGDRAGYYLYERVHPWFMFVDVEKVNKSGISFFDRKRIDQTQSHGFYKNPPIQDNDGKTRYYDVGATFYEDVNKAGLTTVKCKADPLFFSHYEGMSWKNNTGMDLYAKEHDDIMKRYRKEIEKFSRVEISGGFCPGCREKDDVREGYAL